MNYNVFLDTFWSEQNIIDISKSKLDIIIDAYKMGIIDFTLSGKKYSIKGIKEFRIFTYESEHDIHKLMKTDPNKGVVKRNINFTYLTPEVLSKLGTEVTDQFIENISFGEFKEDSKRESNSINFVDINYIKEFEKIELEDFDLSRLIKFCNEINDNYENKNFLSVAMIGRSIINHVPPLLGFETFNKVANNYSWSKSHKKVIGSLNTTLRNIADSFLHEKIRKKERIPGPSQVNFSMELDVLLSEIIRISK